MSGSCQYVTSRFHHCLNKIHHYRLFNHWQYRYLRQVRFGHRDHMFRWWYFHIFLPIKPYHMLSRLKMQGYYMQNKNSWYYRFTPYNTHDMEYKFDYCHQYTSWLLKMQLMKCHIGNKDHCTSCSWQCLHHYIQRMQRHSKNTLVHLAIIQSVKMLGKQQFRSEGMHQNYIPYTHRCRYLYICFSHYDRPRIFQCSHLPSNHPQDIIKRRCCLVAEITLLFMKYNYWMQSPNTPHKYHRTGHKMQWYFLHSIHLDMYLIIRGLRRIDSNHSNNLFRYQVNRLCKLNKLHGKRYIRYNHHLDNCHQNKSSFNSNYHQQNYLTSNIRCYRIFIHIVQVRIIADILCSK